MDKNALRKEIRSRGNLSTAQKAECDKRIAGRLYARKEIASAKTVLVYLSTNSEPETDGIIAYFLGHGKRVFVPVMQDGDMLVAEYTDGETLTRGAYGIREPSNPKIITEVPDVSVTPMVGFDEEKARLGHGKGCYDKYFAKNPAIYKIGLCYERGKCYHIDKGAYDVDMDIIITEERVIE